MSRFSSRASDVSNHNTDHVASSENGLVPLAVVDTLATEELLGMLSLTHWLALEGSYFDVSFLIIRNLSD